jgi:hypothetical protein
MGHWIVKINYTEHFFDNLEDAVKFSILWNVPFENKFDNEFDLAE